MAANVVADGIATMFKNYNSYLAFIGAITVSVVTWKALASLWSGFKTYLLSPVLGLGADLKSYGSWAAVTGSTDGIGKAYAEELARRGINIVLISRSAEKLKGVAEEIESKYHVKTKCVAADFTGGMEIYDSIAAQLTDLEIGVLVNNVGMSYEFPHLLHEVSDNQAIKNIITVNCNAVTFMTRMVLPKMLERKKGVIINISSLSGAIPSPLLTVYSGTKAYIDFFSRCLRTEYGCKGIVVQSVLPGFVATKLSKIRRSNVITPTPEKYAHSALATVGVQSRTFGYWSHALQALLTVDLIPEWLYTPLAFKVLNGARVRAMKKQQKTQ